MASVSNQSVASCRVFFNEQDPAFVSLLVSHQIAFYRLFGKHKEQQSGWGVMEKTVRLKNRAKGMAGRRDE